MCHGVPIVHSQVSALCLLSEAMQHRALQGEQWRSVVVGRVSDSLDPDAASTFPEAEVSLPMQTCWNHIE